MFYKFYKKSGDFANQTVRKLGRELGTKKIGHTGILDPLASGLMIIATESDTKLLQYIDDKTKTYVTTCLFGYYSDSYDIDTEYKKVTDNSVTKEQIEQAILKIKQQTTQIPPIYSAKKINGQKAYDLARKNVEFEIKPQSITIYELKLLEFDFEKQWAKFEMKVSEGAYVRSVLMDLAKECDNSCVMDSLLRKECGKVKLDNLKENELSEISLNELFVLPTFDLNDYEKNQLKFGRSFTKRNGKDGIYLAINNNQVASVGEVKDEKFSPKKVFMERL
ncbi:tRNA pseudouridine(55) synthase TruB [Mycoplasma hafezii]|uniref:tRNA pseudouridine(55) synthase TruB n=1 Tax=Mycoplasma hafezii TaxID=525886 RepID=UPI003CF9F7F2